MRHTETIMPTIGGRVLRALLAVVLAIGLMPAIVSPAKAYAETTPTVSIGNGTIESADQTEVTVPVHLEFDSCNVTKLKVYIAYVDGLTLESVDSSAIGPEMKKSYGTNQWVVSYSDTAGSAAHSGDVILTFTFTEGKDFSLSFGSSDSYYTTDGNKITFAKGGSGKISYNVGSNYTITYTSASGTEETAKLEQGKKLFVDGVESTPSADTTVPAPTVPDEYLTYGYSASKDAEGNLVLSPAGTRKFDFTVNSDGTTATITKCNVTGDVAIPESVSDANGTYAVTALASSFEYGNHGITSISVPGCIGAIPFGFCASCNNLTSVTLGDGIASIADNFCGNCTKLGGVTVPDSVQSIGGGFLASCTAATSVKVGTGVTSIGVSFCSGCTALEQVEFAGEVAPAFAGENHFGRVAGPLTITVQNSAVAEAVDVAASSDCGIVYYGGTYTIKNLYPAVSLAATNAENLKVGETLTVNIGMENLTAALQGKLTWSENLELQGVVAGDALAFADGKGGFMWSNAEGYDAHVFSFEGNIASAGGIVAVATFKCTALGEVSVSTTDAVAGKAESTREYNPADASWTGRVYGAYTLGDVNDNGKVNIVDAQIVLDMANGAWTAVTQYDRLLAELANGWDVATLTAAADVNGGGVDATDARAIQVMVHKAA